jgi:CRP/FNR family transcriptional regulator, nitrogen fixation regulation protein
MLTSLSSFADVGSLAKAPPSDTQSVQSFSDRRESSVSAHVEQILYSFASDSEIYAGGDENSSFFKVLSGVVRTCKFRRDGQRQIDAFHLAGEIFGLDIGARHPLSAEAVCDCTVVAYCWRPSEARGEIEDRFAGLFFNHAMENFQRAQQHSLLLGCSATQKVAGFLVEMADRAPCHHVIDLAMARQDIADYLCLTIETVSRTLSKLERDAVIALAPARRVYVKNRPALRRLSC